MFTVHTVEDNPHLWITYNRFSIEEKKLKKGVYYHWACQNKNQHGTIEVRADGRSLYKSHVCSFDGEENPVELMLRAHQRREETISPSHEQDLLSINPLQRDTYSAWIYFQNSLDLSFRGALSQPLLDFARCLIRLGQHNPVDQPETLFHPVGRKKYSGMHKALALAAESRVMASLNGKSVCCLFDATKIGQTQFLVTYLCEGGKEKPLFYSLKTDISTQEEYATYSASLVTELLKWNIRIVSFCTDGLKHQVQAISGYKNSISPFFCCCLNHLILFFFFSF
jgi:hypothetical protein